jgi:hypothetical protein
VDRGTGQADGQGEENGTERWGLVVGWGRVFDTGGESGVVSSNEELSGPFGDGCGEEVVDGGCLMGYSFYSLTFFASIWIGRWDGWISDDCYVFMF